jgi:hypothetical protein
MGNCRVRVTLDGTVTYYALLTGVQQLAVPGRRACSAYPNEPCCKVVQPANLFVEKK